MQGRERVLIDRQTLAKLTGRSQETIRKRCDVVEYRDGKALYDMNAAEKKLKKVPARDRKAA